MVSKIYKGIEGVRLTEEGRRIQCVARETGSAWEDPPSVLVAIGNCVRIDKNTGEEKEKTDERRHQGEHLVF